MPGAMPSGKLPPMPMRKVPMHDAAAAAVRTPNSVSTGVVFVIYRRLASSVWATDYCVPSSHTRK